MAEAMLPMIPDITQPLYTPGNPGNYFETYLKLLSNPDLFSGHLYAATVADFSGTDSLIIKDSLRTEQYDYKHLNGNNSGSSIKAKNIFGN